MGSTRLVRNKCVTLPEPAGGGDACWMGACSSAEPARAEWRVCRQHERGKAAASHACCASRFNIQNTEDSASSGGRTRA
eukprot:3037442-Pleurochrysis_carterae.AAC.3